MVGVHPTHRRRGLLVRMMEEQLADVVGTRRAARGAHRVSESAIYGRFGYGLATFSSFWTLPDGGHDVRAAEHRRRAVPTPRSRGPRSTRGSAALRRSAQASRRRGRRGAPSGSSTRSATAPTGEGRDASFTVGARIDRRARRRLRAVPDQGRLAGRDRRRTRSRSSTCTRSTTRSRPRCGSSSSTSTSSRT